MVCLGCGFNVDTGIAYNLFFSPYSHTENVTEVKDKVMLQGLVG